MEENNKRILIFSDLEGTILRESDGKYDDEDMFKFIEQIDNLEETLEAKAVIHLVSPVSLSNMKKIRNAINKNILLYNEIKGKKIKTIQYATAEASDKSLLTERWEDIIPIRFDIRKGFGSEKLEYVKPMIEEMGDSLEKCIYIGNGRNDILSMQKVQSIDSNNPLGIRTGFAICPQNSRSEVKQIADFTSTKNDLKGITEALQSLCQELKFEKGIIENSKQNDEKNR